MKYIFTTVFLGVIVFSFAQKGEIVLPKKWSFGINFSPDYCYRILNGNSPTQPLVDSRNFWFYFFTKI